MSISIWTISSSVLIYIPQQNLWKNLEFEIKNDLQIIPHGDVCVLGMVKIQQSSKQVKLQRCSAALEVMLNLPLLYISVMREAAISAFRTHIQISRYHAQTSITNVQQLGGDALIWFTD